MTFRTHSAAKKFGSGRVKKLKQEAFRVVEEKAREIADALYKSTLGGKVQSTKLLVDLAEQDVDPEEVLKNFPLRTLALKLAKEAQWKGEIPDDAAETEAEDPQPAQD